MSDLSAILTAEIGHQAQSEKAPNCSIINQQTRRELIAQAAYFRAQRRAFAPGHEKEDWVAAELEVDKALSSVSKA